MKFRFVKKKEVFSDSGVGETTNKVDVLVILGCVLIIMWLLYLGVMAYAVN